jgi:hypothetical protein
VKLDDAKIKHTLNKEMAIAQGPTPSSSCLGNTGIRR